MQASLSGERSPVQNVVTLARKWLHGLATKKASDEPLGELSETGRIRELSNQHCISEGSGVDEIGHYLRMLQKLEQAFEQLVRERISIATYRRIVRNECRVAKDLLTELDLRRQSHLLGQSQYEAEVAEVLDGLDAAKWCLEWAETIDDAEAA